MTKEKGSDPFRLAVRRQLVELMCGRMGLESEVGDGSAFCLALPLAMQD